MRTTSAGGTRAQFVLAAAADPSCWRVAHETLAGRFSVGFAIDLRGTLEVLVREQPRLLLLGAELLDATADACLREIAQHIAYPLHVVVLAEPRETEPSAAPEPLRVTYLKGPTTSALQEAVDNLLRVDERAAHGGELETCDPTLSDFAAHRAMVLGVSPAIRKVLDVIRRVARVDVNVLLSGETGTGKELIARRLHCLSERARGPFRAVNLSAVPDELFESILYGHERGAFTGAVARNPGVFEQAAGGTLLLDELSSASKRAQPKLLRALQEREFERVGARETTPSDVRFIAATNENLRDAVERGEFREDLYQRLSVIEIKIPPLRQRPEDIPRLIDFFIKRHSQQFKCVPRQLTTEAMKELERYSWPGNIRELENRVAKALLLGDEQALRIEDFFTEAQPAQTSLFRFGNGEHSLADVEQAYIEHVMARAGKNQSRAAQILGIDRKTLRAKLRRGTDTEELPTLPGILQSVPA